MTFHCRASPALPLHNKFKKSRSPVCRFDLDQEHSGGDLPERFSASSSIVPYSVDLS
jgi:hypothetical protein